MGIKANCFPDELSSLQIACIKNDFPEPAAPLIINSSAFLLATRSFSLVINSALSGEQKKFSIEAFHMTVYETATPAPNVFGKVTTFSHITYLVSVFIDIIFSLNITNFIIDFAVANITAISLILYGSSWFKLTAKLHRE